MTDRLPATIRKALSRTPARKRPVFEQVNQDGEPWRDDWTPVGCIRECVTWLAEKWPLSEISEELRRYLRL